MLLLSSTKHRRKANFTFTSLLIVCCSLRLTSVFYLQERHVIYLKKTFSNCRNCRIIYAKCFHNPSIQVFCRMSLQNHFKETKNVSQHLKNRLEVIFSNEKKLKTKLRRFIPSFRLNNVIYYVYFPWILFSRKLQLQKISFYSANKPILQRFQITCRNFPALLCTARFTIVRKAALATRNSL